MSKVIIFPAVSVPPAIKQTRVIRVLELTPAGLAESFGLQVTKKPGRKLRAKK